MAEDPLDRVQEQTVGRGQVLMAGNHQMDQLPRAPAAEEGEATSNKNDIVTQFVMTNVD